MSSVVVKGPGDLQKNVLAKELCSACGACTNLCPYIDMVKGRASSSNPVVSTKESVTISAPEHTLTFLHSTKLSLVLTERTLRWVQTSEYCERQPCLKVAPPEKRVRVKTWEEVIEELKNKHKHKAKVAVYPDATIQKPF